MKHWLNYWLPAEVLAYNVNPRLALWLQGLLLSGLVNRITACTGWMTLAGSKFRAAFILPLIVSKGSWHCDPHTVFSLNGLLECVFTTAHLPLTIGLHCNADMHKITYLVCHAIKCHKALCERGYQSFALESCSDLPRGSLEAGLHKHAAVISCVRKDKRGSSTDAHRCVVY